MSENRPLEARYITCPACFAKDIDPVILRFDEKRDEYYCQKCTYFGSKKEVFDFLTVLQKHRYRVNYLPRA